MMNEATSIEQYIFVQIGEEDPTQTGATALKLHSGIDNPMPKGFDSGKWDDFIGVAGFLALSQLSESNRTSSNGFQVVLRYPPVDENASAEFKKSRADLIRISHSLDVADWPICIWLVELPEHVVQARGSAAYVGLLKDYAPKPLIIGQLGTPAITPSAMTFNCYTAGHLLDRAYGKPVIWNDFQQNRMNPLIRDEAGELVDPDKGEDGAFQFADRTSAEMGADFP